MLLTCLDSFGSDPSAGPGMLKIEPAGDPIYVHYLSSKENTGLYPAFHGIGIYLSKFYAATGYKFFFESCFSLHDKFLRAEISDQFILFFGGYISPAGSRINVTAPKQV
jgi:hypothetical protein